MKKIALILVILGLLVISLAGCSGGQKVDNNAPLLSITGKIVRLDYTATGVRYFFDSGAWVGQAKEFPGVALGSVYKISYREDSNNSIVTIQLVEK